MTNKNNFWESKSLDEMSDEEWESVCDGCGRCCLVKLQDDETEEVFLTNIACQLLDIENSRCRDYPNRIQKVPMCMNLKTDLAEMVNYLPHTCAYRLLYTGKSLANWHPLVSLNVSSMHDAGVSVSEFAVCESAIHPEQMEDHIIDSLSNNNHEG